MEYTYFAVQPNNKTIKSIDYDDDDYPIKSETESYITYKTPLGDVKIKKGKKDGPLVDINRNYIDMKPSNINTENTSWILKSKLRKKQQIQDQINQIDKQEVQKMINEIKKQ